MLSVLGDRTYRHLFLAQVIALIGTGLATGELVSRRHDLWRTFDFVWMFHIMDYDDRQDVNNILIRIFTWMGVATAATGGWLLLYSFRRKRRVRKAAA